MKFIYGKNDWKTVERGEENGYLMSNGLGGFSSLSSIASCSRNDHAVLMACIHAPNHRYNMIHRLEEHLFVGEQEATRAVEKDGGCGKDGNTKDGKNAKEDGGERTLSASYTLSSQQIRMNRPDGRDGSFYGAAEEGYRYQTCFAFEDYPIWTYLVPGVEIRKAVVLAQGENTVAVTYEIQNRTGHPAVLEVKPWMQFVPKGERLAGGQEFFFEAETCAIKQAPKDDSAADGRFRIFSNGQMLYARTNGSCQEIPKEFCDTLYYAADVVDGKMALGRCAANHVIRFPVEANGCGTLELVYGMTEQLASAGEIRKSVCRYRRELRERAGFSDEAAEQLAVSADQYISDRASTGGKTILAGFPFFEDWGRDTMIALPGCTLATGQYGSAKSILETFLQYCRRGLMPNLFPEGTQEPWYNTADAALLFILAVYEYEKKTHDTAFVRKAYPVMQEIIRSYREGTDFHIHMEEDGLIAAGSGYEQVTWMDVRVENILPTPRHGKPVEINAYWYNALRMMEQWQERFGMEEDYGALAERVRKSFEREFWNEETQCLRDVISGTKADDQIRCNQIWAVAQPFSVLPREKEKKVVEAVFYHLYTPYGLRTLSFTDEEFHPFYGGVQLDRDLAYHQGTVWVFPLGAYYRAYLKVNEYSDDAKAYVLDQLALLEPALREGCVGQLPEIYDGGNPVSSKGCFAQAWSVGEILRVYDDLRNTISNIHCFIDR